MASEETAEASGALPIAPGAPQADAPLVWLDKQGAIIFNKAAYVRLSYAQAIELRYDAAERSLGLRAVPMTQPGAFWVVQRRDAAAFGPQRPIEEWAIYAAAFLEGHDIAPKKGRRFTTHMTADVLTISLRRDPAGQETKPPPVPRAAPAASSPTPDAVPLPAPHNDRPRRTRLRPDRDARPTRGTGAR